MNVYCVFLGEYSERSLVGVFESLELAMKSATGLHEHTWREAFRPDLDVVERGWACGGKDDLSPTYSRPCEYEIEERVLHHDEGATRTAGMSWGDGLVERK